MRAAVLLLCLATSAVAASHNRIVHKVKRGPLYTLDSFLQGQSLLDAMDFAVQASDNNGAAQCEWPTRPLFKSGGHRNSLILSDYRRF